MPLRDGVVFIVEIVASVVLGAIVYVTVSSDY